MTIKLIISDLDRTLLYSDKTLSAYTIDVLNRCRERGILVAFATARPIRTVAGYLAQVPCDAVAYHNGACAFVWGRQVYSAQIGGADARALLQAVAARYPQARLSCEIDDVLYANFDVYSLWNYTAALCTDFTDLPDRPADKLLVGLDEGIDADAIAAMLPAYLYTLVSEANLLMIMNRNASKLHAAEAMAGVLNVCLGQTVSFGDDWNDLDLLRACGMGVAVANALPEVKAAARALCATNDEDGPAKWIEENILG